MVNRMILQGRLCSDPGAPHQQRNSSMRFRVAWSEKIKDRETKLFPCVAWQGTAEMICNHFAKGKGDHRRGQSSPAGNIIECGKKLGVPFVRGGRNFNLWQKKLSEWPHPKWWKKRQKNSPMGQRRCVVWNRCTCEVQNCFTHGSLSGETGKVFAKSTHAYAG